MNLIDFRLLWKIVAKCPCLDCWLLEWKHGLIHDLFGSFEVTSQQMTRSNQRVANVIQMFSRLIARKRRCGFEDGYIDMQQVTHCVAILDLVESP